MLDRLIHWALHNRLLVVALAVLLVASGAWTTLRMPVDVFPDLTAPTVTIIAEARGLAPEEVESLVTFPIETTMNGATGVRRVRSSTAAGVSVIWVEFEWDTDIFRARQLVNEKLQLAQSSLPPDLPPPALAPVSSIMGEIMFIGVKANNPTVSPLDVRATADWMVRRRLLAVPGVSQVIPIGGDVKQFQVLADPARLLARNLGLTQITEALGSSNRNVSGGFVVDGSQEYLLRGIGRFRGLEDIQAIAVGGSPVAPVLVRDVAEVRVGPAFKRGEGSINGAPAVVMAILKQPDANTLELTGRIDRTLDSIQTSLPAGIVIDRQSFRQADFIARAIHNVRDALRDGAILVVVILFLFLLNVRATLISLLAIPLSLLTAVLCLKALGGSINTMTLGGLTIAIGALVDDAIIDVENVHRRLRENRLKPLAEQRPALAVIYDASREVRGAIFFATLIIMLVFVPVFFLSGVEGRLLQPLGFAYVVAIFASLLVALTITPVACYYLLAQHPHAQQTAESASIRVLKALYLPILTASQKHPGWVIALSALLLTGALAIVPQLGRVFLPEFREGALTLSAVTLPGTSLGQSDALGRKLEELLHTLPEVRSTSRRTGRAELDEHAQGVNSSEIEVVLQPHKRSFEAFLDDLRQTVSVLPMQVNIGGPLAHRIDHMLSGTRSNIALKLFGEDLGELRRLGKQVESALQGVPGVVDLGSEQQVEVPQLAVRYDPSALARYGLGSGELGRTLDTAFQGAVVSKVLDGQKTFDLVVRYPDEARANRRVIADAPVALPTGGMVPLKTLAAISEGRGPNTISRENVQRKLVVSCNVAGRDLASTVADMRRAIDQTVDFPAGYHLEYGGQLESADAATQLLGWLTLGVVAGILLLLVMAFGSVRVALIVLANLPLALMGGIVAVWCTGGVLSIASLIGFITLFGIATRNGLMLVSHYHHLMEQEGESFERAITRGSLERLSPILMTALTAGLALIPLIARAHEPGNEIQAPTAIVILGGLLTSTFLNMVVLPALYAKFGRPRT